MVYGSGNEVSPSSYVTRIHTCWVATIEESLQKILYANNQILALIRKHPRAIIHRQVSQKPAPGQRDVVKTCVLRSTTYEGDTQEFDEVAENVDIDWESICKDVTGNMGQL